jgi:asparagine synthase (glutamine-hydrolysing)
MSGITGYWGYATGDLARSDFAAFANSLAHRGPDGFGIEHFAETRLWLGHRRLAVLDLAERARQPMTYGQGRYWLTYDGEIYNSPELREELRGLGHSFVTESDGEVILAAYAQWGHDCLLRFNGMWAFALWDARERRLFLSRDRFGVKPLLYHIRAGAFAFASELKAFLALSWIDGAFDVEALVATLVDIGSQEVMPDTLLPQVRRLPPGHHMVVEADGRLRSTAWWNSLDHLPHPPSDLNQQAEAFRALLLDACRLRLRGDVPIAVEQSGGLDSSAIACSAAALASGAATRHFLQSPRHAFIASFSGTPYDESDLARVIVDHTGMTPHYENIDDRQAIENIEQIIFDHEIIFAFPRVGPWALYRAMHRAGLRASLNGNGCDDLLGSDPDDIEAGLRTAIAHLRLRRYWELRQVLSGLETGPRSAAGGSSSSGIRSIALRELRRLGLGRPMWRALAFCRSMLPMRRGAARRPLGRLLRLAHSPANLAPPDPRLADLAPLQAKRMTDFDVSNALFLANFDRASMAHGVEARMPFMDWRLVTFGLALPETSLNGGGHTKRVLRLAMEGSMPDEIRLRTNKAGFVSPLDDWARAGLKPWLLDLCASKSFLQSPVWDGPAVRAIVERSAAGRGSLSTVWPILQAHALERAFVARAYGDDRRVLATRIETSRDHSLPI